MGGEGTEDILLSDPAGGLYKLVLRGDRLVGVCLYGDTGRPLVLRAARGRCRCATA
jgi:NAD(P)H-nitrite reductase large subunit